jgi:hypothetical protein
VQVPGIGLWKKEIFEEAVRIGALIKRTDPYLVYAIPTETKLIGKDPSTGKKYSTPLKVTVVSQKWYDFKRKHNI